VRVSKYCILASLYFLCSSVSFFNDIYAFSLSTWGFFDLSMVFFPLRLYCLGETPQATLSSMIQVLCILFKQQCEGSDRLKWKTSASCNNSGLMIGYGFYCYIHTAKDATHLTREYNLVVRNISCHMRLPF